MRKDSNPFSSIAVAFFVQICRQRCDIIKTSLLIRSVDRRVSLTVCLSVSPAAVVDRSINYQSGSMGAGVCCYRGVVVSPHYLVESWAEEKPRVDRLLTEVSQHCCSKCGFKLRS